MLVLQEYDLRGGMRESSLLEGHQDSVTGLDIHPDGTHLLSNGMDHAVNTTQYPIGSPTV